MYEAHTTSNLLKDWAKSMSENLIDYQPHWVLPVNWSLPDNPFYIGVRFFCPHCDPALPIHGAVRRQKLVVMFSPPIDPTDLIGRGLCHWPPEADRNTCQRAAGDTFDTLTMGSMIAFDTTGHWRGEIREGKLITLPR